MKRKILHARLNPPLPQNSWQDSTWHCMLSSPILVTRPKSNNIRKIYKQLLLSLQKNCRKKKEKGRNQSEEIIHLYISKVLQRQTINDILSVQSKSVRKWSHNSLSWNSCAICLHLEVGALHKSCSFSLEEEIFVTH